MIWEFAISQSYNYLLILLCVFISVLSYLKIFLMLRHYQNLAAQQKNGEPDGGGIPVKNSCQDTEKQWLLQFRYKLH